MADTLRGEHDVQMQAISSVFSHAEGSGFDLKAEVFWSAMHYLKKNPEASIPEAIGYGFMEWDV